MTDGPPLRPPGTDLIAEAEEAARAERESLIEELGHDAVLWLALVPLWTKSAAEAAGFPTRSVVEFVQRARKAGWCETRGSLRGGDVPGLRFWMPSELRRDVLDHLRRYTAAAANEISARVLRLSAHDQFAVPGALEAWAELLAVGSLDRALIESISQAVDRQDLGRAQEYVSAGEALAALLAGTMVLAVDRARRLLSLGHRRRMDARDLERYLDRPELSGVIDHLLTGDTRQWALHLRGVGGVGKTMLIRYLASGRYAADRRQEPIPIARVDFDYMSPDYPMRRPVQLLLELADELSLHTAAVGAADHALARFRATATTAHEAFSGARAARASVTRDERVLGAISDFADALRRLPRVLLILDTCEELAKADVGDPAAPAVTTTFQILERIHERAPNVRVLFAGRRPLPAREYLIVQPVAGFTVEEARQYLAAVAHPRVRQDLADAIIRQSSAVDDPARVSPFDLALYRSWGDEDPGLTAEQVARGSDAYIEGRIIERLGDGDVLRALPALATADRCRVTTIADFLGVHPASLGPRLAEQEWIDADGDPPAHVIAKPALARRLRRYFTAPDRAEAFASETTRLAAALRTRIRSAPVADIDRDEVLAALRLSAPADAARLWDDLAVRAKDAREWDWLLSVTNRVLGEWEEEEWPTTAALRATVTAAHIAASRRAYPSFSTAVGAWTEVLDSWPTHPDPLARLVLRIRAALGLLKYSPDAESLWEMLDDDFIDPELLAARVDAIHHLLEAGEDHAAARMADCRWPTGTLTKAWARVTQARLYADENRAAAEQLLTDAEHLAVQTQVGAAEWFDWIQPDDLVARIRMERGLIAPPGDSILREWEDYAADHFGTIDAERLASACLRIRLSRGVVDRSMIDRWAAVDRYEHAWRPACSAHDLVPPLFVSLAEAMLAVGEAQRALDLLDRRREAALRTRADEATIRHADSGTVRIARRFRLENQRALITRLAGRGDLAAAEAEVVAFGERTYSGGDLGDRLGISREPRIRSADPWSHARETMLRAVVAGEPYGPPPEMPNRLFAEMAFDGAEALHARVFEAGLSGGERLAAAARMFGHARDAYEACGDRIGQVLALASLVAITGDQDARVALDSAIDNMRTGNPAVARALTGPPDRAGPWRYWAALLSGPPPRSAPPPVDPSAPGSAQPASSPTHATHAPLGVLSRAVDPIARRHVGFLPLKFLNFLAVPAMDKPDGGRFLLWSRLRWLWPERPRARPPEARPFGYFGWWQAAPGESPAITWGGFDPPTASGKWWSRGTASGVIDVSGADASLPWERMLSESLGPDAAGRVSWYRRTEADIRHDFESRIMFRDLGIKFTAPDQWRNLLPARTDRGGVTIQYAIGRATSTSAGPRLDIGRDTASGAPEMMDSAEFARSEPELIVLQALPVADESELFAGDDLPEKLELAVELINAGAAPAVLVVPAIPAALASDVVSAIEKYVAKNDSMPFLKILVDPLVRRKPLDLRCPLRPRRLQAKLRKILAPHVPLALLDDLILFVNEGVFVERKGA